MRVSPSALLWEVGTVGRWICAVIACARPEGQPHVETCPYFGDGEPIVVPPLGPVTTEAAR